MDFTLKRYNQLINCLIKEGYSFQTFEQFIQNPTEKVIILRHDVDRLPSNSLTTAKIENAFGIRGSYYFRIVKESNKPEIIKKIVDLGHEIGYHYETLDTVNRNSKRRTQNAEHLFDEAYKEFCDNLEYFRTFYPVKTICMHGSPLSKYDNKDIWNKYDYKRLGLIGEPYFDIDFSKVFYLTDTGRRWDGEKVSVRDKVKKSEVRSHTIDEDTVNRRLSTVNFSIRHTDDIIKAIDENRMPNQIMITIHPQRWNDSPMPWVKELVMQKIKNVVKRVLILVRRKN